MRQVVDVEPVGLNGAVKEVKVLDVGVQDVVAQVEAEVDRQQGREVTRVAGSTESSFF